MATHDDEPRPDTGFTNVGLAVWLVIAGLVMLFGGFCSAHVLLAEEARAVDRGGVTIARAGDVWVALVVLLAATVGCSLARRRVASGASAWRLTAVAGCLLGVAFVTLRVGAHRAALVTAPTPRPPLLDNYLAMTGVHALLVAAGTVCLACISLGGGAIVSKAQTFARLDAVELFWRFLVVMWVIVHATMWMA